MTVGVVVVVFVVTDNITVMFVLAVGVVATVVVIVAIWCSGEVIDTLVEVLTIDVRADVLINAVDAVEITLEFALPVLYSVNEVLSNLAVDLLMGAFASVVVVKMIGVLSGIDVDALVDVNVNVFAGIMGGEFAMSAPLEGFCC